MHENGMVFIIKEYKILYESVKYYKKHLEVQSEIESDDDKQLLIDEKIQDAEGVMTALLVSARRNYGIEIE